MGGLHMEEDGDQGSRSRRLCPQPTLCCVIISMIILFLIVILCIVMGFFIGDKFGPTVTNFITNTHTNTSNGSPCIGGQGTGGQGTGGQGTGGPSYAWSQWSACSKTCWGGMRTRSQMCGQTSCITDTKPCNSPTCPVCQFKTSLDPNTQTPAVAGITWTSGIVAKSGMCANQGVLHLVPPTGTTKLHVYMHLNNVTGWSLHLADHKSYNGWGGGSGPYDPWVAEIHNVGKTLNAYGSVAYAPPIPPLAGTNVQKYFSEGEAHMQITVEKTNRVTMTLWEEDGSQVVKMWDHHMFKFDDFYLGINRVVQYTSRRTGSGLCSACIRFE